MMIQNNIKTIPVSDKVLLGLMLLLSIEGEQRCRFKIYTVYVQDLKTLLITIKCFTFIK